MKKRIIAMVLATAVSLLMLASCDAPSVNGGGGSSESGAHEIYAMSLVSSIGYLSESAASGAAFTSALSSEPSRPEFLSDSDVLKMEECLVLFNRMIEGGGVDEEVRANTSTDAIFGVYALEMTVSLHNAEGGAEAYTLYFNEIAKNTESETENGIEEIEESTTFEGVAVFMNEIFIVKGEREVEREGNETEVSIEFRTYRNIGGEALVADEENYVEVEKSAESGEFEYEYTFVKNGNVISEIEIEYEITKNGIEVSFETEGAGELEMRRTTDGRVKIFFERGNTEETITVTEDDDGSYKLIYSNGYEEIVNKN